MAYREISSSVKQKHIDWLIPFLPSLRAKAGITSAEISNILGISRQTYSAIENGKRPLPWNTFLAMILFFEYNDKTREFLHINKSDLEEVFKSFNSDKQVDIDSINPPINKLLSSLDAQAQKNIKDIVEREYNRCNSQ